MEERIKVLMIGPDRGVHGGISGVVNNYYEAGITEKINLTYIGTMVEGSKLRKLWQAFRAYVQFLHKLPQYPIVHVNMASDSSYYRKSFFIKAAKRAGKKIVIHQHGGDFETFYEKEQNDRGREKIRRGLNMADVFLVLAPAWKTFFQRILPEKQIIVFPDTIRIPENYEKEYGQQRILFLGRLCKAKGIEELIQSMVELHPEFPSAKLLLGGIWEDTELQGLAQQYPEFITELGWITGEAKQDYLKMCDIFALPSYFEGQSIAILEAMAHYCGIAASDTGGIPMMITNEQTGLLTAPQNKEELKNALKRLLESPGLCKKLGENARRKAEEEFSIDGSIQKLAEIYRDLSSCTDITNQKAALKK